MQSTEQEQVMKAMTTFSRIHDRGPINADIGTVETYAVDFDGTLCENKYPDIGREIAGAVDTLKALQSDGCKLILWTCRTGGDLQAAVDWCKERGLIFDAVNATLDGEPRQKISATYYVDDRNTTIAEIAENRGDPADAAAQAINAAVSMFNKGRK